MPSVLSRLAIKIWLPFAIVLMVLLASVSIYYPKQQESTFRQNKEKELKELAKTVALGVELSLRNNDFKGLQQSIQFVSNMDDFDHVAILSKDTLSGKETVFISFPEKSADSILNRDKQLYLYQTYNLNTPEINGVIQIAVSTDKINKLIDQLNRPVYLSLIIIFAVSLVVFFLIAGMISKPITKLTESAKLLEAQAYDKTNIPFLYRKDEIGGLAAAFESLKSSLLFQKSKNDELTANLEQKVLVRTEALQQTQDQLLTAQQLARLGQFAYDYNNDTWTSSGILDEILGIDDQYQKNQESWFSIVSSEERENLRNALKHSMLNKLPFKADFPIVRIQDGEHRWVSCIGTFVSDHDGRVQKLIGTIQDITDRKENEETVRRLSYVAQYTSNCVIIADKNKKIQWVNDSLLRLSGYSYDEIIGQTPKMFQFEKSDPNTIREISEKLNKLELINTEVLNRGKHGNEYWLELNIVPIFSEQGEHTGYIAVEIDITDRKRTEERLKRNQEELKQINETLEQKVIENTQKNLDLSKSIVEQEKMATVGEIAAGIAHDLNTPLGAIRVGSEIALTTLKQLISNRLFNLSRDDFEFVLKLSEQINTDGISGGLQSKKEQQEVLKYLEQLPDAPSDRLEELADWFVKSRITITSSSLINQVITKKDPHQLLQTLHQIQVMQKILNTIHVSVDKASKVIKDVRSFIKEDSVVQRGKINLRDNIDTVLNIFNYELKKNVNLEIAVDPTIHIDGFDIKLFQLWSNLIKNALDAMDGQYNKQLWINGQLSGDKVIVAICNNGPDIEPAIQTKIFDKFFTTKQHKSGTGLGLSIVKNVLEDHGGSIQLESENGKTCFNVTLPRA
jgi:PAS domain S-box-containing protein